MITKTFKNRRSATDLLRKLGVPVAAYDNHVFPVDGKFTVNVDTAKLVGEYHQKQAPVVIPPKPTRPANPKVSKRAARPVKAARAVRGASKAKPRVGRACLALLRRGLDNAAVFAKLQVSHGLGANQRHYPAWYRRYFTNRGELAA